MFIRNPQKHFLFEQIATQNELTLSGETICVGDQILAWGGPSFGTIALTGRGKKRYLVNGFFLKRGRTWLDCTRLEFAAIARGARRAPGEPIASGRFLLYVSGPIYRRAAFPGVRWRPFKVKKVRPPKPRRII